MNNDSSNVYFQEVQRFRQVWVMILVLAVIVLSWIEFVQQIIFGIPFGDQPPSDLTVWIIWIAFGLAFPWFWFSQKLITEVRRDSLKVQFFPIKKREVSFAEIKSFKIETYKPIRHFGGWGVRRRPDGTWAYTVSGNQGILIEYINGDKLLIGSSRAQELYSVLQSLMRKL